MDKFDLKNMHVQVNYLKNSFYHRIMDKFDRENMTKFSTKIDSVSMDKYDRENMTKLSTHIASVITYRQM